MNGINGILCTYMNLLDFYGTYHVGVGKYTNPNPIGIPVVHGFFRLKISKIIGAPRVCDNQSHPGSPRGAGHIATVTG